MEAMYKNLLPMANMYEGENDSTEITELYQQTQDPKYLSYIFCNYYRYIRTVADRYFYITEQDKGSYAIEELHKAMLDYDSSKGAKIETLYVAYYERRLRMETQALNTHKRKANNECEDYAETVEINEGAFDSELAMAEIALALEQSAILTENELAYCRIIMLDENTKDSDVAKLLDVSASAVHQMKKRIAKKLSAINFKAVVA